MARFLGGQALPQQKTWAIAHVHHLDMRYQARPMGTMPALAVTACNISTDVDCCTRPPLTDYSGTLTLALGPNQINGNLGPSWTSVQPLAKRRRRQRRRYRCSITSSGRATHIAPPVEHSVRELSTLASMASPTGPYLYVRRDATPNVHATGTCPTRAGWRNDDLAARNGDGGSRIGGAAQEVRTAPNSIRFKGRGWETSPFCFLPHSRSAIRG